MPKVSVIIPTHNRAPLLRRAVLSVLRQTCQDFEIVIADDASGDETREVVLSMNDPRIKYLHHPHNIGVARARNTAITHASGAYIAFLDDDDEWLQEKLSHQLMMFAHAKRDVGAIYSGYHVVDSATNRVLREERPSQRGRLFETMLTQGFFFPTSTIIVKAECFDRVGLLDPTLRYCEDFDMWLRIAKEYEFDFVDRALTIYYEGNGLSFNYEAVISGNELMLRKYRDFFERNPSVYGDRLQKLGSYYCFAGNVRKGRQLFRRSIEQDRLGPKSYVSIVLSLFGTAVFRACYAAKNWRLNVRGYKLSASQDIRGAQLSLGAEQRSASLARD